MAREYVVEWWAELWATPQAVMWDQSGRSLHRYAQLQHDLVAANDLGTTERGRLVASLSAEMRQLEDRHGLTPKAMLQLRWMISDADPSSPAAADGSADNVTPLPGVEPPAPVDDEIEAPRRNAKLDVWIEWAILCGATREQVEGQSRKRLIEIYGERLPGDAPPPRRESAAVERLRARRRT